MAKLLFVRSGDVSNPVTGSFSPEKAYLSKLIAGHGLEYLGLKMPVLGQSMRAKDRRMAEHVVLELSAVEAETLGWRSGGLYRVAGLPPRTVTVPRA